MSIIKEKYSTIYDVTNNKNFHKIYSKNIELYASLCASVDVYETFEKQPMTVLHIKWSTFGKYDNPRFQTFLSVHDFVPVCDREFQLYLQSFINGTEAGKKSISNLMIEESLLPVIQKINEYVNLKSEKAVEDFKYEIQNM